MSALLTLAEVAAVLRVHRSTVWRMCRDGDLPGAVLVRGQWRVPQSAVDLVVTPTGDRVRWAVR